MAEEAAARYWEARHAITDVRLFREMYGQACLSELTHADMLRHRDALLRSGICRTTINKRIGAVKRMIAWALDEALIPAQVKAELTQVSNLKPGRSAARETDPVRPVPIEAVETAMANMMPNTADMVRVHRLTGMRPEEVCNLRWSLIDTTQTPWVYRPSTHKNKWRGQPRIVLIGPKAREILSRHKGDDIPFSPITAIVEYMAAKSAARTSPFYPCRNDEHSRAKPVAQRRPRPQWDSGSYAHTVAAACRRARIQSWSPNRLRHAFATDVRQAFGLAACRAVLGHSTGARITDRYSYAAIDDEMIRAEDAQCAPLDIRLPARNAERHLQIPVDVIGIGPRGFGVAARIQEVMHQRGVCPRRLERRTAQPLEPCRYGCAVGLEALRDGVGLAARGT